MYKPNIILIITHFGINIMNFVMLLLVCYACYWLVYDWCFCVQHIIDEDERINKTNVE